MIQFVQPGGGGTGTPGQALIGNLSLPVTVQNNNNSQVATLTFEVVSVPPGSTVPTGIVQDGSVTTYLFTPDVRGGYEIHLTTKDVDGNFAEDYRVFQVAETTGRIIPPFKADANSFNFGGQTLGWAPYVDAYLRALDTAGIGTTRTGVFVDAHAQPFNDVKSTLTTDATANVVLHNLYTLPVKTCARVDVLIKAKGAGGIAAEWHIKFLVDRDSGSASIQDTAPTNSAAELKSTAASALLANATLVGNVVTVVGTGIAATNITWGVTIQIDPVTNP